MKNKLLLAISLIFLLTACNSNKDLGINITENDLLGNWNFTEYTLDGTGNANLRGITITTEANSFGKDYDFTLNFSQKPNEFSSSGSFTSVTTIKLLGQADEVLESKQESLNGLNSGSWSLNGNTLKFSSNGEEIIAEIIEYKNTKLRLELSIDEIQNIYGLDTKIIGKSFITLEK